MMNFTAIDFETATARPNSACSVAAVEIIDGKVARSYYTLIRPPGLYFLSCNIRVHGIRPDMVRDERDFPGIWPELSPLLEDHIVVAHNAPFDMGVLRESLKANGLPFPRFRSSCTVQLSRKAWPCLSSHKLDVMGEYLGIEFRHHNALDDALVCSAIPLAAAKLTGDDDFCALAKKLGVAIRPFARTPVKS